MTHAGFAVKNGSQQAKQNTRDAIEARQDFKTGGAMRAETENGVYRVYSYNAIIAEYRDGGWTISVRKYSATTGTHQSAVRQALAGVAKNQIEGFLKY